MFDRRVQSQRDQRVYACGDGGSARVALRHTVALPARIRRAPGIVPDEARKHLPRYPLVSLTLIGRLAVAKSHQGQGLGGALLVRTLRKAYESADIVGSSMVVVDAVDEGAAKFYSGFGFVRLPESLRLVMPMESIGELFAGGPGLSKRPR